MAEHNIYRDGKVHVLSEECATCIFRPNQRPVPGSRVAEMVRETKDNDGATVVCHSTLYKSTVEEHAICRGWYDRLGDRDSMMRLAKVMGVIEFQEPPLEEE